MQINFKNVLVGLGASSIVMLSLFVAVVIFKDSGSGLLASLTNNSYNQISKIEKPLGVVGAGECKFKNYAVDSSYKIPTYSQIKQGSSINIDSKGNVYSLFTSNNFVEKFNKDGSGYKQFTKDGEYSEQTNFLPGMYIDEDKKIAYIPGASKGYLVRLYRYDLDGNLLTPNYFTDNSGFLSVDGYNGYIFSLPATTFSNKSILKKYNFDGKIEKQVNLPFGLYVYPDMAIGQDGIVYVPMNIEKGIFEYNNRTGKNDILAGFTYVSTILRYNPETLDMIDANISDSPFYKIQEKRVFENGEWQKFKEGEIEQTYSRISIGRDGNLNLLMKNPNDLDKYGYANQNLFRQYDKNGNLLKEWSSPGLYFHDLAVDSDGNVYAVNKDSVYKYKLACMGKLIVKKIEVPDTEKVFNFKLLDPNNFTNGLLKSFKLANGGIKEFLLKQGVYNIEEEDLYKEGYTTKIDCTTEGEQEFKPFIGKKNILDANGDPTNIFIDVIVHIDIKPDAVTTCTFTNTKKERGLAPSGGSKDNSKYYNTKNPIVEDDIQPL